jgi:hypothetical protein
MNASRQSTPLISEMAPSAEIDRLLPPAVPWQFRTSSLLWLTLTAAMVMGYARSFGTGALFIVLAAPTLAAIVGAGVGAFTGRLPQAIYWAVVGATLGAICVVAAPDVNLAVACFWPILGAAVGAFAGAIQPRITSPALAGAALLCVALWAIMRWPLNLAANTISVDLAIAPLVAAGLAALVRLVEWLQARRRTSREVWAAGMIFAVIAGNLWAVFIAGRSNEA